MFLGSNVTSHSPTIFQVADKANNPHIKANVNGEIKQFAQEEISAMVLGKMKEIAEAYLGHEVTQRIRALVYFSMEKLRSLPMIKVCFLNKFSRSNFIFFRKSHDSILCGFHGH